MSILGVVPKLYAEMEAIGKKIAAIQAACTHPMEARDQVHKMSDNYDGQEYWTNHTCGLCLKQWTTPQ